MTDADDREIELLYELRNDGKLSEKEFREQKHDIHQGVRDAAQEIAEQAYLDALGGEY